MEVTFALPEHLLELAGLTASPAEAIASGRAFDTWQRMIRVQGGDPDASLPAARHVRHALLAPETGWVTGLDALAVGIAAWRLGAGRARKEDDVSHTAGVRCLAKPGTTSAADSPYWSCTPTTSPASPRRPRRWRRRARSRSAARRRRGRRWSSA